MPLEARPVDMGLPSGLQWSNCNVGAVSPYDLGLYFSWGDTEGHAVGEGYDFSQAAYDSSPAASIISNLSLDQDAARANNGAPWRMPTVAEYIELCDNCTIEWTTMNGVKGRLFTSNVNGRKIFFPAAGYYNGESLNKRGVEGFYWVSTYESSTLAHRMKFSEYDIDLQDYNYRYRGFPVRAVIQST